jgi:hypothetical protein
VKLNSILAMYGLEPAPDLEEAPRYSSAQDRLSRLEEEWSVDREPTEPATEPTDEQETPDES